MENNYKPKYGDWCIFYNKGMKSFRVSKFKQIARGKGKEGLYKDQQSNYYEFCEPYEGHIPKEVK